MVDRHDDDHQAAHQVDGVEAVRAPVNRRFDEDLRLMHERIEKIVTLT